MFRERFAGTNKVNPLLGINMGLCKYSYIGTHPYGPIATYNGITGYAIEWVLVDTIEEADLQYNECAELCENGRLEVVSRGVVDIYTDVNGEGYGKIKRIFRYVFNHTVFVLL